MSILVVIEENVDFGKKFRKMSIWIKKVWKYLDNGKSWFGLKKIGFSQIIRKMSI